MTFKSLCLASSIALLTACGGDPESSKAPAPQSEAPAPVTNEVASKVEAPLATCGEVTIAEMNWNSAALMANVDQFILEHGYGCDAKLVTGDTMPTGTSMVEKGQPDVAPELWSNGLREALDRGVAEKRLRYAGNSLSDGGEEALWIPKYLADENPELATIGGIKANAKLFKHPEDPEKSMLMGCPAGWNCQIVVSNLHRALELEEAGFDLVDPGSGAALAGSIAKAYERKEAWFGYYWAPTAVLGKYEMTKVDFGTGVDDEHFKNCITQDGCEDPKPSMFPASSVQTVTTESFASKSPEAYDYFTRRAYTNSQMNQLLAWMEDNQADGKTAAEHFIKTQRDAWSQWVSEAAAAKIDAAIANI